MGRRIGFNCSEDEEDDFECEGAIEVKENTMDLHDEIVKAINTLISAMKYARGSIKGITITVDTSGSYSTKIKY